MMDDILSDRPDIFTPFMDPSIDDVTPVDSELVLPMRGPSYRKGEMALTDTLLDSFHPS